MIPHYEYEYQKNVKRCELLWKQQNLAEFKKCIDELGAIIIKFAKKYDKINNSDSEQASLTNEIPKIVFLDTEIFNDLKQRLEMALDNGAIPAPVKIVTSQPVDSDNTTNSSNISSEVITTSDRENTNMETINIYDMTDVDEILKWCSVLKSGTVPGSQVEAPQCYQRVLELEPRNYTARRSIRSIKAKYTQRAMRALASAESGKSSLDRALNRAKINIDRVKAIDPDDAVLAALIQRYEDLEAQHKAQTLDECYDIADLVAKNESISDEDKNYIKQNCPSVVIDEVEALIGNSSPSFIFDIDEEE
jgi:hypothetical protein